MKLVTFLIAAFFAGALSAQTMPAAETKAAPVCKTGKPCGNACIAQDKTCSVDTKAAEPVKAEAAKPATKPETKAAPKKAEKVTVEAKKEPAKDVKKDAPKTDAKAEVKKDAPKAEAAKVEAPKAEPAKK